MAADSWLAMIRDSSRKVQAALKAKAEHGNGLELIAPYGSTQRKGPGRKSHRDSCRGTSPNRRCTPAKGGAKACRFFI